jgi:uncharacterized membrane protein YbjE (DUF340 family)
VAISNNKLTLFFVLLRAIVWIIWGVIFGAGAFLFAFASAKLHNQAIKLEVILSYDYVMYICVVLMAGAAADFFCSAQRPWPNRVVPILVCIPFLFALGFIFESGGSKPTNETLMIYLRIIYVVISFFFCLGIKSVLFYEDSFEKTNKLTNAKF